MPVATFYRVVEGGGGTMTVEDVELPFTDEAYVTVIEALSDMEDPLHHPMWRAILQHIEDEVHG